MGFWKCTHEDPFTRRIRELYAANVVHAPRVGFDPLEVMATSGDHVERRGTLRSLLSAGKPLTLPGITDAPAAALNGLTSTRVDAGFGAKLTGHLLGALGIPTPSADIKASLWKGASHFSFEVRDVVERSINVGALGGALAGFTIDGTNEAASVFFPPVKARMHIVTRTLVSLTVAVRATAAHGQHIDIGADAVASLLGNASARVDWNREGDGAVVFRGEKPATFAFATVPCNIRDDMSFSLGLEVRDISYLDVPGGEAEPIVVAIHLPLVNSDGLLDVSEGTRNATEANL
jgi:hypothetical protein